MNSSHSEPVLVTRPRYVLVRVVAPHFVAGVLAREGEVVRAAPILRWMVGMDGRQFYEACRKHLWRMEVIDVQSNERTGLQ